MRQCAASDCQGKHAALGYCMQHYQQLRNKGEVGPIRKMAERHSCALRDSLGRKLCTTCELWVDVTEFAGHPATSDRLQSRCRRCFTLAKYNLTKALFSALLDAQGGVCGICATSTPGGRGYWHIDHDHSCCAGQRSCGECVRGILCHACNTGLGSFKDNPDSLRAAVSYLERELVRRGYDGG